MDYALSRHNSILGYSEWRILRAEVGIRHKRKSGNCLLEHYRRRQKHGASSRIGIYTESRFLVSEKAG